MKHPFTFSFPLWGVLCLLLSSCEKEGSPPEVEILEPQKDQSYSFGDTLKIRAQAQNARAGMQVSLQYRNEPVGMPGSTIYEEDGEIYRELYYTQRYLNEGTYEVKVTARNSETFLSDFQSIFINALPLRQKGMAYLNQNQLHIIDSAGKEQVVALGQNYAQMTFAGRPQMIALRAKDGSKVQLYEPKTATLSGEIFPENGRAFVDVQVQDGVFYLLQEDGVISAYRDAERLAFRYRLPINRVAENLSVGRDGLTVTGRTTGSERRELFYFKKEQSVAIINLPLQRRAALLRYWNNGNYLLAYADENQTELMTFDPQTRNIEGWTTLQDEKVQAMVNDGAKGMYLRTDVKVLQIMNPYNVQPVEVLTFAPTTVDVSQVSGQLYFSKGSLLQRRMNGQHVFVTSAAQPILDFSLIYNK